MESKEQYQTQLTEASALPSQVEVMQYADSVIASLRDQFGHLTIKEHGYDVVKEAIREVSSIRIQVEKDRKKLKKVALEYGRKVDAEAKRVTQLILCIEEPLVAERRRVDNERIARLREEKEAAEARERAEREARQAEERARQEEARKKLEEEKAAIEKEKAEIEAERAKLAAERAIADAERREREAKAQAEEEAKRRAEREAVEAKAKAEREAREKAEREAREKAAADELAKKEAHAARVMQETLSDRESLSAWARKVIDFVRSGEAPEVSTDYGASVIADFDTSILDVVNEMRRKCFADMEELI